MDTNPAHDGNYESQDGLRRAQRDPAPQPQNSEAHLSAPMASKSADAWSSIREMARDFGVSIRALRFYEDRGLLHPKREGTARRYSARDRLYLKMILKGKQLGFTLSEIRDILASREAATGDQNKAIQPSPTPDVTARGAAPQGLNARGSDTQGSETQNAPAQGLSAQGLADMDLEFLDLEMGLPPEQIVAQINHLERQRKDLDEAILALRAAHRRLVESPRPESLFRAAIS
jgi:DNA-binding transcriptional MerR regulator